MIRGLLLPWVLAAAAAANAQPIAGIDHIPTAVKDLDAASARYRELGFVLKAGRLHDNGLLNNHAKFPDGTEIELITAGEPRDALARTYLKLIAAGDGPAFLALHSSDFALLERRLTQADVGFRKRGFLTPTDPRLDYLFFVGSNRSPTDRPEHFAHANATSALIGAWIADAGNPALRALLAALGAKFSAGEVSFPERGEATFAELDNGIVTLLPESARGIGGRPIIGAVLRTGDLDAVTRRLRAARLDRDARRVDGAGYRALVLPPGRTHGLWLEFRETPAR